MSLTPPTFSAPPTFGPCRPNRFLRGRRTDPRWVRPALLTLLSATALLFSLSDAADSNAVDKPPASLWVTALSARIFGLDAWSQLVPQALGGVAAVGLLYVTVRRFSSAAAGLIAGAALALIPVATLMFRFDNPDALVILTLVAAAYCIVRAIEPAAAVFWTRRRAPRTGGDPPSTT
jgi:4-amino-4-deoxy-L-arabinose transferase-like glycosyltransferase